MAKKNTQQIKFEAKISEFQKAIKDASRQITSLSKELKLNKEQLKGTSNSVTGLQDKLQLLKTEYKQQTEVVENSRQVYEKAVELFGEGSVEAKKWADKLVDAQTKQQKIKNEIELTNKQIEEQSNKLVKTGKKWEETGDTIVKVGDKVTNVGKKLSIVSAGILGAGIAIGKSAIDYETAFTGVKKTVDGTDEELQKINEDILNMSTRLPVSATEIAGVAESAGQLGIKTKDISNFTETIIGLSSATNLTTEEAGPALAKFANITGMSADNFERLGSVIVDLGNNSATTEADIVSMATRLAATGELTGLTEAQIMGVSAAMSSVGIEAEAGGTAMSKLLSKIKVATETGGKDLNNFAKVSGMSAKEFKKAFQEDSVGALTKFIAGLNDTKRNGKSAIAVLQDMGIKETRLTNTILSLSNASDVLTSSVDIANKAWKDNTALQKEVNTKNETTESKITMLKNEVKKLAIETGNELLPTVRDILKESKPVIKTITEAVKKFSELDSTTKSNILRATALLAAIGPITTSLR